MLFLIPPTFPGRASTKEGSSGGDSTADESLDSQADEKGISPVESESPEDSKLSESSTPDQDSSASADSEKKASVGKNDSEERAAEHDVGAKSTEHVTMPSEKGTESDPSPETLTEKKKTVSRFFTLDTPPKSKQTQLPKESSTHDPAGEQESGLSGRAEENKEELLRTYGGTETTEAAVKLGLEWLARNQRESGLWGLQGPFSDGGGQDNVVAATAMALLAFQGAGHTHQGDSGDPFTGVVRNGWKVLLEYLDKNRNSTGFKGLHGGYTEALCTIAICELYGMTKDRRYRKPAIEALEYCLRAQSSQGGWRYLPRQDSDTSVTGWFLMALQSARMAKLKVPKNALVGVSQYLNAASSHGGERYAYMPGTASSLAMTAEGLLCRQYLGWKRDDPHLRAGTDYLLQQLPDWKTRNVYYWYYATQVTHHMGGKPWRRWNEVMRILLPAKQIKKGNERGSWDPQGHPRGGEGGRLYVTCLSLYMLEVYYRHLPIYRHDAVGGGKR